MVQIDKKVLCYKESTDTHNLLNLANKLKGSDVNREDNGKQESH